MLDGNWQLRGLVFIKTTLHSNGVLIKILSNLIVRWKWKLHLDFSASLLDVQEQDLPDKLRLLNDGNSVDIKQDVDQLGQIQ